MLFAYARSKNALLNPDPVAAARYPRPLRILDTLEGETA
jgi:hypothetical protein